VADLGRGFWLGFPTKFDPACLIVDNAFGDPSADDRLRHSGGDGRHKEGEKIHFFRLFYNNFLHNYTIDFLNLLLPDYVIKD
jgi:hypothetical protein